jgi:hypothetical protein
MPTVYWDVETYSQISLKEHGAHIYALHRSTGIYFLCYAVDDGDVQTWRPGDPVPFVNRALHRFVAWNWTFENAILHHDADSGDCGQAFRLIADTDSDRSRTAFR